MFKEKTLMLTLLASLQLLIYNVSNSKPDSTEFISGRFINVTFVEKLADTIAGAVPVYCVEMNFRGPDSAEIFNGFEDYKLAYKKSASDYVLQKAVQGNDLPFTFINDSTIILIDTMWTGSPGMSVFSKVNDEDFSEKRKWLIDYFINEKMITGKYLVNEPVQSNNATVTFNSDGSVSGLKDYTGYFICYSGDCVGETKPVSNLIIFKNISGEETEYAFEINKENNTLRFYNIAPPIKDIKGERSILDLAFELRKKF